MRKTCALISGAALALASFAAPAIADPGNGKGKEKGGGNAHTASGMSNKGNGKSHGNPGQAMQRSAPSNKASGMEKKFAKTDNKPEKAKNVANPGNGKWAKEPGYTPGKSDKFDRGQPARIVDVTKQKRRDFHDDGDGFRWLNVREAAPRHLDGCPPGLAKKNNGCLPPGQAKKYAWNSPAWYGSGWDRRYSYRYLDGYMLELGQGGGVRSYIPLLGGALSIGNPFPSAYEPVILPSYYVDYYGLGPSDSYRYYDNTIYRVDPETAAIQSIAALLTGQDFVVGQPMPMGYDVYNVPAPYRTRYYDQPDAMYRYNDGYVYRVDPETQLVLAAINLLT